MRNNRIQKTHHAGDVAVSVTSEANPALDDYLSDYLTRPLGIHQLPTFQLNLWAGTPQFERARTQFISGTSRFIEPIPGVVLTETTAVDGSRRFRVAQDDLENVPDAWIINIHGQTIELFTRDPTVSPRYVLRIIRELMIRNYENANAILFHAAGMDLGGTAVMICGSGTAGKTTTLATLLHSFGERAALLSNDRLLVLDHHQVVTVPLPVPVARGTIEMFDELRAAVPHARQARPGEIAFDMLPREFGTARKLAFPARVFAAAFGSGLVAGSRLAAVVIPSLTDSRDPVSVQRLNTKQAAKAFAICCFTPVDEFWSPWLVHRIRSNAELSAAAAACIQKLAVAIPCFAVSFGIRGNPIQLVQALTHLVGDLT